MPEPNPYPWNTALFLQHLGGTQFSCGGFLVDPAWVLTAAHCVTDPFLGIVYPAEAVVVAVGARDLSTVTAAETQAVAAIYVHPQWDPTALTGDVALLRLQEPSRNDNVPVLPLRRGPDPQLGATAQIAGWGLTEQGLYPDVLRHADVEIAAGPDDESCREVDASQEVYGGYVAGWMTCAGGGTEESIASGCFGDSGSALMVRNGGTWEAVGVTSWGWECGDYFLPGIYTRISRALSWVDVQMANPGMQACGIAGLGRFTDVEPFSFYDAATQCLGSRSITQGWQNASTFNPSGRVTRAQMAAFLWRMEGRPGHPAAPLRCGYDDVTKEKYFARASCWMKLRGITTGWGGDPATFHPAGVVTRGQTAAFLWRYAGRPEAQDCAYGDVDPSAYYAEAVCWLKESGITTADGTFNPTRQVTRAQVAAMLWRLGIATDRWFALP